MEPYLTVLYKIVTTGLKTSLKKRALWRALANLAPTTDEKSPKVSKDDLSLLFSRLLLAS